MELKFYKFFKLCLGVHLISEEPPTFSEELGEHIDPFSTPPDSHLQN